MRVFKFISFSLVSVLFPLSAIGATHSEVGETVPAHPNPLMQSPATIATFAVSPEDNFRARKVTVLWRMAPNSINTRGGVVDVPAMLARGDEFAIHLVDPSGNTWPLSKPVMYTNMARVFDTSIKASEIASLFAPGSGSSAPNLSDLGAAMDGVVLQPNVLDPDRPDLTLEDITTAVSLIGPQLDSHGYVIYGDNSRPLTTRVGCSNPTWHRTAARERVFPVCSREDISAFSASYSDEVNFSRRQRTVVFEFPSEVSTYGVWQLVAVDTRPVEHDLISMSMIPLNSNTSLIQPVSSEAAKVPSARFPRMRFDATGIVFDGERRPLPDTGPRTERFRNELSDPRAALIEAVSSNMPELPNMPSVNISVPTGVQPSPLSNQLTDALASMAAARSRNGANSIVMSGQRLQELDLSVNLRFLESGPRLATAIILRSPGGTDINLGRSLADGEQSWQLSGADGTIPPDLLNKPIDGTWKLIAQGRGRTDISSKFAYEMTATVTGPGTDFFIVEEFDEPVVLEHELGTQQNIVVNDTRDVRKIWFRAFADNFVGFRHDVSLRTPQGNHIPSCRGLTGDQPCIEVGSDGLGKIVNLDNPIPAQGTWSVSWRAVRAENLLGEDSDGGIEGGVCEATDLQANNDPTTSALGERQSNPFGISASQFNQAWLLSQNKVTLHGFLLGFGETPADKNLIQHAFLDRAEEGVLNRPWFERFMFSRSFWGHIETINRLKTDPTPEEHRAFFQTTLDLLLNRQLNKLAVFNSASAAEHLSNRMLGGQDFLGENLALSAFKRGLEDWIPVEGLAHERFRNTMASMSGFTASVPFNLDDDMSFYMQGGTNTSERRQSDVVSKMVTGGGATGGLVAFGCALANVTCPGIALTGAALAALYFWVDNEVYEATEAHKRAQEEEDSGGSGNSGGNEPEEDSGVQSYDVNYKDHGRVTYDENGAMLGAEKDGTYHLNGRKYECIEGSCTDTGESDITNPDEDELKFQPPEEVDFEDDEASSECPPDLIDGCGEMPPQSWFDQYLSTSSRTVADPFVMYWGNFAPYINCGPEGCTTAEVPQTNLESQGLDPWINCGRDGATCGDDSFGKACTSFNWADTFTDPSPVPEGGPVPDDPAGPDCTDSSNPCENPGG